MKDKKKTEIRRHKPTINLTIDARQIKWMDEHVGNKSRFIGTLIDAAMLLPHPEELRTIIERHIKAKTLEAHRLENL